MRSGVRHAGTFGAASLSKADHGSATQGNIVIAILRPHSLGTPVFVDELGLAWTRGLFPLEWSSY